MKGAIFIALNQMVEEQAGIDAWEQLLQKVQPDSGGIYTSVEAYADSELFALVTALSEMIEVPVPALVESFGSYLFDQLNAKYPTFAQQQDTFFDFVKSIDGVIHKEVQKLYNNPNLPKMDCEQVSPHQLVVEYRSPRKLCVLAEGLIRGAARHYDTVYELKHTRCLHHGNDHCRFEIEI